MNYNIEDSRIFKAIVAEINDFKEWVSSEVKEIKESIETLKAINKEKHTLTEYDVKVAWLQFRVDFLTGIKKCTADRFKELKEYMLNVDLAHIPEELKDYIDLGEEETNNE